MNKLLRAGYAALFRNKFFYLALIGMALYAAWIGTVHLTDYLFYFHGDYYYDIYDGYTTGMLVLYFVIPAFCAWMIGNEHGEGTLRNKIIAGHPRVQIYFAQLLVVLTAGAILFAVHTVVCFAFEWPMSGGLGNYFVRGSQWIFILSAAVIVSMSALCTMISMTCRNKMAAVILAIFLALLMLMVGLMAFSKLTQPEFITVQELDDTWTNVLSEHEEPNPDYPRGVWRKVYTFLLDFLPGGHLFALANGDTTRAWIQTIWSGVIALVSTAAGLVIFRREDLK